jgi:hypothetical protein
VYLVTLGRVLDYFSIDSRRFVDLDGCSSEYVEQPRNDVLNNDHHRPINHDDDPGSGDRG